MTELELLAGQLDVNERTLRRAVHQGTLRGQWRSPRRLEMSAAEKQYARRSWPLLSALRATLRTEQNVRLAVLFGSTARGDGTAQSDIDVLVAMRDPSLARVIDLGSKLEGILGRRVDVVPIEDAEAAPHLLSEAVADGRVLVDRENRWPELRKREPVLRQSDRRHEAGRTRRALAGIDSMLAV